MAKSVSIVPVLSYYNAIADQYDNLMQGETDQRIRQFVRNEFIKTVPSGNVLDFGGGTGQDLRWLLGHAKYNVFFFEPCSKMCSVAENSILASEGLNKPTIVKQYLDIRDWKDDQLPVTEKMDGVLANFAVLNCIKDISELFEKLALVCNSGASVVATVLDSRISTILRKYPLKTKLSAILGIETTIYGKYNGLGHATQLHSLKQFRSAANNYFEVISYTPIDASNFALLKLIKK